MKAGWVILGAIGLYLAFQYERLKAVGNLIFFPGQVSNIGFDNTVPTITFTIQAQNTSSVPIQLDSLAGNLFVNGTLIGNISSFVPTLVPGNGQAPIPVKATLMILGVVNDIIQSFINKSSSQQILVEGFTNVQGVQVPLTLQMGIGL